VPVSITSVDVPGPAEQAAVRRLADALEHSYGTPPLSDRALGHLGSAGVRHWLAVAGEAMLGYAQLDAGSLELAAAEDTIDALLAVAEPAGGFSVWSQGRLSPLITHLDARGYERRRTLYQLRRSLADLPAAPGLHAGITVRPFRPGVDEGAWLAVNSRAFATHPEQGGMTEADLLAREAEPWFDPAGFLLAERDGRVLGFHWTKIHADGMGEVYVLGVDPDAQGLRLGPALLGLGLRSLAERGCAEVLLYVDADNTTALRLYSRLGFTEHDRSEQWHTPDSEA
jgi:mycothiol synthase